MESLTLPRIVLQISVLCVLGISSCTPDRENLIADYTITYENPERTAYASISEEAWTNGTTMPIIENSSQNADLMMSETVGKELIDCSDNGFRCVQSWGRTYAIPRKRLSPSGNYSKNDVTFQVETCIRGDSDICQVALIGGYCRTTAGKECGPRFSQPQQAQEVWSYVVYFIYNEDFGVTSMGVTKEPLSSLNEKMLVASQLILQGRRGILFSK